MNIQRNCKLTKVLEALVVINQKNLNAKRTARSEINTDRLLFNDETFMIIKLLTATSSERDKLLRKESYIRNLCCPNTPSGKPFVLNPCLSESFTKINLHRKSAEQNNEQLEQLIGFDQLNEVNFLIIDLMRMDAKERGAYLLNLAEKRRILFRYCDSLHVVNPILNRLKIIFSLENFITKVEQFSAGSANAINVIDKAAAVHSEAVTSNPFKRTALLQDLNLQRGDDISKVFKGMDIIASSQNHKKSQDVYNSVKLNGENLLLLDLLAIDKEEDRQQYITDIAVKRKILVKSNKSQFLELNPSLLTNTKQNILNVEKCLKVINNQEVTLNRCRNDSTSSAPPPLKTTKKERCNSETVVTSSVSSAQENRPGNHIKKERTHSATVLTAVSSISTVVTEETQSAGSHIRKERCDSETVVANVPHVEKTRSKSIDVDIKTELHKANERLQQKLLKKMKICDSPHEQQQQQPLDTSLPSNKKIKRSRGKRKRRNSVNMPDNDEEDLPTIKNDPEYDTSVYETLESIAEKLSEFPSIDSFQLGSSSAYAAFLQKVDEKLLDISVTIREKCLIYKPKSTKTPRIPRGGLGSERGSSDKKIMSFSEEVNRAYQDATGRFSASMAPLKLQSNISVFDVPENIKSIEKFVAKLFQEEAGKVYTGEIRINNYNPMQAYVPTEPNHNDGLLRSIQLRQCAMHGDIVKTFVFNRKVVQASTSSNQPQPRNPLGFVVNIIERKHNREALGHLAVNKNHNYFSFFPTSKRIPRIKIFKNEIGNIVPNEQMLYLAKITEWTNDVPLGTIIREIGDRSALSTCNEAILIDHQLEIPIFTEDILNSLPSDEFVIPASEYEKREVLTKDCVFTIDPATARDLDDAMSCRKLSNGNYEIGVHISDVTYFIAENCDLDNIIKEQATSIYLVDTVYHMLPRSLCMTCSLLPGEDKLTFSVFWEITKDCRIVSTRFSKTIINSCAQLAYSHAQNMLEQPNREFGEDELPPIANGYTARDLSEIVNILHKLSVTMRQKRFDNMCIKIDQPKISFDLDGESGEPVTYRGSKQMEANFLIEEFMLLANQSVAIRIFEQYPSISLLRRHSPPKTSALETLVKKLNQFGMELNIESSAAISESFYRIVNDSNQSEAFQSVLNDMLTKPMNRAE